MFTTTVAWIAFIAGSFFILLALLDTIFQFTVSDFAYKRGMRRNYFTAKMAFILVVWFLSGMHLFG
jgi:hypothetical protein